jgi:phytanoyl-CoA hydroxylase
VFAHAEIEAFRRDGYLIRRGLVEAGACERMLKIARDELARAEPPLELEAEVRYPGAPASMEAPGGRTVRRLLRAYSRHHDFAEWAVGPEIAAALTQLIGPRVELSQVHHNCVMTKAPSHSSSTGWHRDIRYWSFESPELVSSWLALMREREDNGCLKVLPGSHLMTFGPGELDDAQFLRTDAPENAPLLAREVAVELDPGDVLFFDARLFHAAGRNITTETKFSVVFTYHDESNRPVPGSRSASLPDVALAPLQSSTVQ